MSIIGILRKAFGLSDPDPGDQPADNMTDDPRQQPSVPSESKIHDDYPVLGIPDDSSMAVTTTLTESLAASENPGNPDDTEIPEDTTHPEDAGPELLPKSASDSLLSDAKLPGDLFDGIIELFNAALPKMVSECMDISSQRQRLLADLDERLRRRLATEIDEARRRGHLESEAERECALAGKVRELESLTSSLNSEIMRLSAAQTSGDTTPDITIEELQALRDETEALKTDNARLMDAVEQHKAQKRLADAMINNLRSTAVKSREDAEEIESLRARVREADATLSEKDDLIAELNETIRANLYNYSLETARMSHQIDKLKAQIERMSIPEPEQEAELEDSDSEDKVEKLSVHGTTVSFDTDDTDLPTVSEPMAPAAAASSQERPRPRRQRRRNERPVNSIDEYIEGNDWFGTSYDTAPDKKSKKTATTDTDDDFGYKTPPRKPEYDNKDQLSLW